MRLRANDLSVYKLDVLTMANGLYEESHPGNSNAKKELQLSAGFYSSFLHRNGFRTLAELPLETSRKEWCTEKNMEGYFRRLASALVMEGIALANPDYDPLVRNSELVVWIPGADKRVVLIDETNVKASMKDPTKDKSTRIVAAGPWDTGSSIAAHSSASASMMAAIRADGKSGRAAFVHNCGASLPIEYTQGGPIATLVDSATGARRINVALHPSPLMF